MFTRAKLRKILKLPVHSLLISVYPVIHLYSRNIVFVPFQDTLRWSALSLGVAAIFLVGFALILRSWTKAGILASSLIITFYTFGRVADSMEGPLSQLGLGLDATRLASLGSLVFLLSLLVLIRAAIPDKLTLYLNVVSLVLISLPLFTILSSTYVQAVGSQFDSDSLTAIRREEQAEASMKELSQAELPDIYYIILDGYVRADVLDEFYDYDNSSFIAALEDRGFFVASESRSNYLNTTYSLNTSLNLIYFRDFPARMIRTARYNLRANYVSEFLRDQGYEIIVFDSGTGDTNNQYADRFLSPHEVESEGGVNAFEQLLLRTTMGSAVLKGRSLDGGPKDAKNVLNSAVDRELSRRRERIEYAFTHLSDFASDNGRYFVFAHIYLPHIPFLYGPGGEELDYHENPELYWYEVEPGDYTRLYNYQVDYLNQAVLEAIDKVLERTEKPLVIVLQSDHGDERFLDWDKPTTQGVHVRSAILNSIYYSDGDYDELYPSITPVNTFRVVLNHWFGIDYAVLQDRVLFHEHSLSTPFNEVPEFVDACTEFGVCLPEVPPGR
jgi:hypothetical protein